MTENIQRNAAALQQAIEDEGKRSFNKWPIENAWDYPDKKLDFGAVIIDSEHGAVLTEKGIMQITGAGKTGKTMLLFNLTFALALGRNYLSFQINKSYKVLYLNGENSGRTLQERLKLLRDYYGVDDEAEQLIRENFLFVSKGLLLPRKEALNDLKGNISEIQPEIVIIDPLKNFFDGEENSADDMRKFMQAIRQVVEEHNVTVVILHHTGKKKNENDLYTGRGSSVLADDAEITAAFSKDARNKGRFNLSVTGRNCEEFSLHLMRPQDKYFLYHEADKPRPEPDYITVAILDALPQRFSAKDFNNEAERQGLSESTAKRRLENCVNEFGLLKKLRRGEYENVSLRSNSIIDPDEPIRVKGSTPIGSDLLTQTQKTDKEAI